MAKFCPFIKSLCREDCVMFSFDGAKDACSAVVLAHKATAHIKWIDYALEDLAGAVLERTREYTPPNHGAKEINGEVTL